MEVLVVVLAYLAMIILMQVFPDQDIPLWHKAGGGGTGYSWAGWWHTLVELWAWEQPQEALVDRSASPWDAEWRRPSHADRRKAMLREMWRTEFQAATQGPGQTEKLKALAERLLHLAV